MTDHDDVTSTLLFRSRIDISPRHVATVNAMADAAEALSRLEHDIDLLARLLDQAIWTSTEFKTGYLHKYGGVRWRSTAAHRQIEASAWKGLRHEHVVERAWAIQMLRTMPERARTILWNIPVAIVTKEEHHALPAATAYGELFGWERYRDLPILDGETGHPVSTARLATEMRARLDPLVESLDHA